MRRGTPIASARTGWPAAAGMALCNDDGSAKPDPGRRFPAGNAKTTGASWSRPRSRARRSQRLESQTYDGLPIEPLYPRDAAATALGGRAPGAAWTVMQRVDHPDPAAANAQALARSGKRRHRPGAGVCRLGQRQRFWARSVAGDARARARRRRSRRRHHDRSQPLRRRRGTWSAISRRWSKAAARAGNGRSARQHQSDRRLCRVRPRAAEPWTRACAKLRRDGRRACRGQASAARSPSPTAASSTMPAARKRRNWPSRWPARSPTCARWKRSGMALDCRARRDLFPAGGRCRPVSDHREIPRRRGNCGRASKQACGLTPKPAMVAAETAWRMMTKRDPYVNMLRTTIAVAAAGLGGADNITVLPHTAPLGLPDAFARRVARNTQLILLEESNLASVADPAAGSGAHRGPDRQALRRGLGAVPGDRAGRRRLGRARDTASFNAMSRRCAPSGEARGRAPQGRAHRHQRLSQSQRRAGRGARRRAGGAAERRARQSPQRRCRASGWPSRSKRCATRRTKS